MILPISLKHDIHFVLAIKNNKLHNFYVCYLLWQQKQNNTKIFTNMHIFIIKVVKQAHSIIVLHYILTWKWDIMWNVQLWLTQLSGIRIIVSVKRNYRKTHDINNLLFLIILRTRILKNIWLIALLLLSHILECINSVFKQFFSGLTAQSNWLNCQNFSDL